MQAEQCIEDRRQENTTTGTRKSIVTPRLQVAGIPSAARRRDWNMELFGGLDAIYLGVEAARVDAQAKVRVAMDRANIPRC